MFHIQSSNHEVRILFQILQQLTHILERVQKRSQFHMVKVRLNQTISKQ